MHTVVHELAHVIDWHSNIQIGTITMYGQTAATYGRFSSAWSEPPLTDYAAQFHFYPARWDVWAEAVTVWVFGELNLNTGQFLTSYKPYEVTRRVSPGELVYQMNHIEALLNGWY